MMEKLRIEPISGVSGEVSVPGSKSLSNRALLLAAMAKGTTKITNLLDSDDVRFMLAALEKLGVRYQLSEDKTVCEMQGTGGAFHSSEALELYLGNAGTAMRPLCAAICLGSGEYTLTGEPRMKERPIKDLVDALRMAGCEIEYLENDGYPPLKVIAHGMQGGRVSINGSISSQYLTALLMAAPLAQGDIVIDIEGELVSKPYIDITLQIMQKFGVEVTNEDYKVFRVSGGQQYLSPGVLMVEGDASSASYFLAAAAIAGGSVRVTGVGRASIQGDKAFADVLEAMGAIVSWEDEAITVTRGTLKAIDKDLNAIPDAAMTIVPVALFAEGTTTIRNIYNWRVKETDRLAAMSAEARKLGAEVVEGEDFISVTPPAQLQHAEIETYNDHRIAMCFSLTALGGTPVTILDPGCTAKTFPDYFERFASICD